MKQFKQLRGARILLDAPSKDSKLYVDENTREALQREMMQKMRELSVFAVGDLVTDIVPGDKILVDPNALQKSQVIPFGVDEEGEEITKILVSPFDVILVW